MSTCELLETVCGGDPQVDRQAGVIRQVKILGRVSRNGRRYSERALREAAERYVGVGVNLNHPDRRRVGNPRAIEEGFGWLENVQVLSEGVFGDLHFFRTHPQAAMICEAAERRPERFGLSHVAEGDVSVSSQGAIVESIRRVLSVDVVQNPATSTGLFESQVTHPRSEPMKTSLGREIDAATEREEFSLDEEELLPVGNNDLERPDLPDEEVPPEGRLRRRLNCLLAEEAIPVGSLVARLKRLLEEHAPRPLDRTLRRGAARTDAGVSSRESSDWRRELLEAAGIEPSPAKVRALGSVTTREERQELLESWKPVRSAGSGSRAMKPLRSPGIVRDDSSCGEYPVDSRSFAAALRN